MCACQPGGTPCDFMDCSLPDSVFMKFSRQQYWSGLPFPPSGDLPDQRIEPMSPAFPALQVDLQVSHWVKSKNLHLILYRNTYFLQEDVS